ncbi:hypothetical protein ANCCAN_08711 [Ancylostoma caninum]|uniref:C2H2-type domain-containing protein n=1 Tax=Ancylostoma caninum TaxID=29170 RepID=A0A368GQL5_ANCCA|nr:hypothetical protein ANCCAN_08711 [Ancylostoma caninum]
MDHQHYQRRDHQPQRHYYQNGGQGVVRYVTQVTPIGVMHTRIFDNAIAVARNQMFMRPQLPARLQSESDEGNDSPLYTFENFPIDMDDTEVILLGKYSVTLLQQSRFNVIFVRVKWAGCRDSVSMCAMITFGSSEGLIRHAVEECANLMDRCDYLVRHGDRYPVSSCSLEYLNKHHIVVIDKVDENFPSAVYWCTLCDYHMSSIQHVRVHFEQHQHFADEQVC